jgi:hypothetical protein
VLVTKGFEDRFLEGGGFNFEEEVSRWARISGYENS